ncbi:hypothetical protein H0O00_02390 [Candidatus Micrarchaeota archaeon]|nr:hypothetical protein [Candidatus Micrarchaeota archaeon]
MAHIRNFEYVCSALLDEDQPVANLQIKVVFKTAAVSCVTAGFPPVIHIYLLPGAARIEGIIVFLDAHYRFVGRIEAAALMQAEHLFLLKSPFQSPDSPAVR